MSPQAKMDAELTEIVDVDLKFEVKNVKTCHTNSIVRRFKMFSALL